MRREVYALFALLLSSKTVLAQPSAASERSYTAPPECPPSELFWQEVNDRTPGGDVPGGRVSVRIEREPGHYSAHMLFGAGTAESERTVVGEDCVDTATAIALVVALAFEARRQERARVERPASPGPRLGVELLGLVDAAPAPQLSWGGALGLRLATQDRRAELGLVLGYRTVAARALGQGFGVDVLTLRLDACPFVAHFSRRFALAPCAFLDAGGVRARATDGFRSTRTVQEVWGAAGALVRVSVWLGQGFSLALVPGLQAPFQRGYRFVTRDPRSGEVIPLYEVPALSGFAAVSARYDW